MSGLVALLFADSALDCRDSTPHYLGVLRHSWNLANQRDPERVRYWRDASQQSKTLIPARSLKPSSVCATWYSRPPTSWHPAQSRTVMGSKSIGSWLGF